MGTKSIGTPVELQSVPSEVLEKYVRSRLLSVAGNATVSQRLGLPAETIRQAFAYVLSDKSAQRSLASQPQSTGPSLQLTFSHRCQNLGCDEPGCLLCAQNPNRRCSSDFSSKYLAGDVLKANCGGSIKVQVIDRCTLEPAERDSLANLQLEISVIDGKAYSALQNTNKENDVAEVEACVLANNNQGKELLVATRGSHSNANKRVIVPLTNGEAYLPDLVITGSSEALLSGQKPPFRLFIQVKSSSKDAAAPVIAFVVSDAFVVATPRVRTAAKAEIPHLDDHVSKLHSVGNMTQSKLQDIKAAAAVVGVQNLVVPLNTVTKVGQFKELVDFAEQDPRLCETLKKVLKLTRGWEIASEHARTAVVTDNKMRVWCPKTESGQQAAAGLLFRCHLGSADLDSPVALLTLKEASEGRQAIMEPVLTHKLAAGEREIVRRLQREAVKAWWQDSHPGWSIWPIDSNQFLHEMSTANAETLTADHLIPSTATPTGSDHRPVTRAAALAQNRPNTPSQTSSEQFSQDAKGSVPHDSSGQRQWNGGGYRESDSLLNSQAPLEDFYPRNVGNTIFDQTRASSLRGVQQGQDQDLRGLSLPTFQNDSISAFPSLSGSAFPQAPSWLPVPGAGGLADSNTGGGGAGTLPWDAEFRSRNAGNATDFSMSLKPSYNPYPVGVSSFDEQRGHNNASAQPSLQPNYAPHWLNGGPQSNIMRNEGAYMMGCDMNAQEGNEARDPQSSMQPHLLGTLSGKSRKRDSETPSRAQSVPDGTSNPLPSPFGLPTMQDMVIPQNKPKLASTPLINARMSSGIQPSSAKRAHLTPHELQEGLSKIFGLPFSQSEMSKLFPEFSGGHDQHLADRDLQSMPLAAQNLSLLMDSMLDHKEHGARLSAVTGDHAAISSQSTPTTPTRLGEGAGGSGLPGLFQGIDFTYTDLCTAVDLATKPAQERNLPLTETKNSLILMDWMTSRVQNPNDQDMSIGRIDEAQPLPGLKEERLSGLDTMGVMNDALPSQLS